MGINCNTLDEVCLPKASSLYVLYLIQIITFLVTLILREIIKCKENILPELLVAGKEITKVNGIHPWARKSIPSTIWWDSLADWLVYQMTLPSEKNNAAEAELSCFLILHSPWWNQQTLTACLDSTSSTRQGIFFKYMQPSDNPD